MPNHRVAKIQKIYWLFAVPTTQIKHVSVFCCKILSIFVKQAVWLAIKLRYSLCLSFVVHAYEVMLCLLRFELTGPPSRVGCITL